MTSNNIYLDLSDEVKNALALKKPVVALESTIISHGMPYPDNYKTAVFCEQIIRDNGCVPATIAILDGRLKVGLTNNEIEVLSKMGKKAYKSSRRDIAYNITFGRSGTTTVAATMFIANLAGIRFFATGGIGGVHRGAETSFDISADLEELATTNVAVICAGIKSILDLKLTMEYLETKGIPVIGYRVDKLPAFYTRESDIDLNFRINGAADIARFVKTKYELELQGGILITNPVPEEFSIPAHDIEEAINNSLDEMKIKKISGKDQTPYLLSRITELTNWKSLETNIALVYNNCKLASNIALKYAKLYSL